MLNGPSEHPDQLTSDKDQSSSPISFGAPKDWFKTWRSPTQILECYFEK